MTTIRTLLALLTLAGCAEGSFALGTGGDTTPGEGVSEGGGGDQPSGTDADPDCPQSAHFPELAAHPANGAYADPFVRVSCDATSLTVESNGMPTYEYVDMTPNGLAPQDWTWSIPLTPTLAATPTDIPLLGAAAFTVTGLPIFGPNEGAFPDPYGDPVYNGIVDECLGHTAQGGMYHDHALVQRCILAGVADDAPDEVVGYALDGFPIHGPWACVDSACTDTVEMQSGWEQTGDPTTYAWDAHTYTGGSDATVLDACNGHVGPEGDYHYHATAGFPYVLGCYKGAR
jgi:hypothetical protein